MARTPRGDSTARILEITTAVRRDLGRTWSVSQMAQLLGIKGSQLRRLCSDTIHISPAQLLRDIRYAAAASLLENPQLRVKEVLAQVGIRDGSHFCQAASSSTA
jgi:transcriptional regulator GlxA family with amidase domain